MKSFVFITVLAVFFVLPLHAMAQDKWANRPNCGWYVLVAGNQPNAVVLEEIETLIGDFNSLFPATRTKELLRRAQGLERELATSAAPDGRFLRLVAVRDLLRHMVAEASTLQSISNAFPVPQTVSGFRGAIHVRIAAIHSGSHPPIPLVHASLPLLALQAIEDAIASIDEPADAAVAWQAYLPELLYTYSGKFSDRGQIAVTLGSIPTPEQLALLAEQRVRFRDLPGNNPILPAIAGNFTEGQEAKIIQALMESELFDEDVAERLVTSPYFRSRHPIYSSDENQLRSQRMENDLSLIASMSNVGNDGSTQVALEKMRLKQMLQSIEANTLVLNPRVFVGDYVAEQPFNGLRWQDAQIAQTEAMELFRFIVALNQIVSHLKPELRSLDEITAHDLHSNGEVLIQFAGSSSEAADDDMDQIFAPADQTEARQAEKHVAELMRSPLVGVEFKILLQEYCYYVWKLKVPHHDRFAAFITALRGLAELE